VRRFGIAMLGEEFAMSLIVTDRLGTTLDELNERLFHGREITDGERGELAQWLAGRQGQPGGYHGLPAPLPDDFAAEARTYTGEMLSTHAATAHILGEEACRALLLLKVETVPVQRALEAASAGMGEAMLESREREYHAGRPWAGMYCCARCTCAVWRHLAAGGLREIDPGSWIAVGLRTLHQHQTPDGGWRRFPFWYTLLALVDLATDDARAEMRHTAKRLERYFDHAADLEDAIRTRRRALAARVLTRC